VLDFMVMATLPATMKDLTERFGDAATAGAHKAATPAEAEESLSLYAGDVDIVLLAPVDLKIAAKVHSLLHGLPDVSIIRTRGTADRGSVIRIVVGKPVRLAEVLLSRVPDLRIHPEEPPKGVPTGKGGDGGRSVRRLAIQARK
jgi:hypothetical protein